MLRRRFPIITALVLLGLGPQAALARSSGPAGSGSRPAQPHGIQIPDNGALFGVHLKLDEHNGFDRRQAMLDYEALVGRPMAVDREFYLWDDTWPTADDEWSRDGGRTLYFSWDAVKGSDGLCVPWADIAAGLYDATIDAQAQKIIAFAAPSIVSFHHEPTTAPPGGNSCGTGDDYKAAWAHFRARWDADGVTNVTYAWTMTAWNFDHNRGDEFYPGNDVIDLIAADGYNWFNCQFHGGPWREFSEIFDTFYNFGIGKGKPMFVAEYGTGEDPADVFAKAKWFTNAAATLKAWPEIKGVSYFNVGGGACQRYVDTSPESLEAFSADGADPYFNPPPPITNVTVHDFAFTPKTVRIVQGTGVRWTFNGPSGHTVTDVSGMDLFDTGTQGVGATFVYFFIGAGTYNYQCTIHTQMHGQVKVPVLASPLSGGTQTEFTITYAGNQAPVGFAFDVQIKRPGSNNWVDWLTDQYDNEATFVPDAGTGKYLFQAVYKNTTNGKFTKWSPAVTITVS
jgi:hypothetical protein